MIEKEGNQYILKSKTGGKVLGKHSSRAAAKRQEAAIKLSKARRAGHKIPKKPTQKY